MKAEYVENLEQLIGSDQNKIILETNMLHHLLSVSRLRIGEEVLLLNGKGLKVRVSTVSINKVQATFKVEKKEFFSTNSQTNFLTIGLCAPKKPALEECLKIIVELGLKNLIVINSERSIDINKHKERLLNVMISAIKQSNNPFLPLVSYNNLLSINFSEYEKVYLFDSFEEIKKRDIDKVEKDKKYLLLIGPEGGFSKEEVVSLNKIPNLVKLGLPIPIATTPTFVSFIIGVFYNRSVE